MPACPIAVFLIRCRPLVPQAIAAIIFSSVAIAAGNNNTPADIFGRQETGTWQEIPNSALQQVAYRWPAGATTTMNGVGISAVIANWSGATYDTKRDRLLVWGGGHFAYAGNEIYAFDVGTLRWTRISDPSLSVDTDYRAGDEIYADGTPRSNHTYNALQYVPTIDRLCSFGTAANFPASRGGPTTWAFDFAAGKWERKSPAPDFGFGTSSAWDPVTERAWVRINGKEGLLAQWNPGKDSWVVRARKLGHKTWFDHTAAIDPLRRRYVAVGGGKVRAFDISAEHPRQEDLKTTGPQDIVLANSPGFEYDPAIDKFVGWNGGADVFTLDPESLEWRRITPAAANRVVPTAAARNGTYGRFRYIPSRNAYIVVNDVRQNVFIYKLIDPTRGKAPPKLLEATRSSNPDVAAWASRQVRQFSFR